MASTSTIKKFVYVFDVLCSLIAAVLIGFGIYVVWTYDTNEVGSLASYAYIGIGVATFVVFLFGNVGAIRENVCCTITFIILLIVASITQIAVVFLLTKGAHSVASNLSNSLDEAWEEELKSPGAMSIYESWLECCGRASPQDYIVNERLPPATCFRNNDHSVIENLIDTGCRVKFENYWIQLLAVFNILAWILIALELVTAFISCCLCNSIRNDRRRSYY